MSSAATPNRMICPYCRTQIDEAECTPAFCGGCGTPHHKECYEENGGCTLFGCKCAPPDEPKVQVTNVDVVGAPAWPPVAGGYQNSYPSALPPAYGATGQGQWPQPPSYRPGYPAAYPPAMQPQAPVYGGASAAPQAAAASAAPAVVNVPVPPDLANSSYVAPGAVLFKPQPVVPRGVPRSRITYILLGLFLGFFGLHNFYAGFAKRGRIQLCLTIFTLFIALFVTWIWAIVEVCTVDRDNNGVIFA
jgi:TM2 domain-containing membrane protein YozV